MCVFFLSKESLLPFLYKHPFSFVRDCEGKRCLPLFFPTSLSVSATFHPVFFTHRDAKVSFPSPNPVDASRSLFCPPCQWHLTQWTILPCLPWFPGHHTPGAPPHRVTVSLHLLTVETPEFSPWLFFCVYTRAFGGLMQAYGFKYHPYTNYS